ncbi:MAG: hypothetical protein COV59_05150 [Candidatus Magasanikbacteria bacterium CG11_big_fil_rev_8_21_14_0_20_39_34]|uniref:Uncharacterized protein n=1 Tax=Candidatus Magasanikbacteria bacterium CG11_big_fil_rev_8_21_14_0_20_39_34 TaxID=1974653 RepID=A0A2H0N3R9_9BACT|nr:MAG: hypothetical protein COV59_05150 [Candidatus Magasanikbacteria bacterium CG11_big_fil_rev_8_21_14_0_20_39_34]
MKNLKRYIGLAKKTGSPVILCDPHGEDLVLMGIEHYEALLSLEKEQEEVELQEFSSQEEEMFDDTFDGGEALPGEEIPFPEADLQENAFPEAQEDTFLFEQDSFEEQKSEVTKENEEELFDLQSYDFPLQEETANPIPQKKEEISVQKTNGDWARAGDILAQKFQNLSGNREEAGGSDGIHYVSQGQEPAQGIPFRQVDENLEWENQDTELPHSDEPVFYEEPL